MVKTLDDRIKKSFTDLGFSEEEVKEGCWLLERNEKPVAWIALHKFLERVAGAANIIFENPKIMNCTDTEVAILVNGKKGDVSSWSIGEASLKNCKNDYRWAMAEKRAKDRVILKLLGIAGDMYSEEEADEFKKQEPNPTPNEGEWDKERAKRSYNDYLTLLECVTPDQINSFALQAKEAAKKDAWSTYQVIAFREKLAKKKEGAL